MRCPDCGFDNPEGFHFCGKCGHHLDRSASGRPPSAAAALYGERRTISVLFSDLTGYTNLCERLDPEEVSELMSRVFRRIEHQVRQFEGVVDKFMGDGAMILFGADIIHEDDAVRAVKCAMAIHRAVRDLPVPQSSCPDIELRMHSGINTGLVVRDLNRQRESISDVAGDTVNLASRLCSLAEAGEILTGRETRDQAVQYVDFKIRDPVRVKGKAEPVQVYEVIGPRERQSKVRSLPGLAVPFIGRGQEMDLLDKAVQSLEQGQGGCVLVSGDAGTGKSRMLEEFKSRLQSRDLAWWEGHAQAFARTMPFSPLRDMLSRSFDIRERDGQAAVHDKLAAGINDLVGMDQEILSSMVSLYSLDEAGNRATSPEAWKARLERSMDALLSAQSRRRPTVFCFEDLHWADASFLDILKYLIAGCSSRALFLCTARPEEGLSMNRPDWACCDRFLALKLQNLSVPESRSLIQNLLDASAIPEELASFVQDRAVGNPFYVIELVHALQDAGLLKAEQGTWRVDRPLEEAGIPATVQGVLSSRVDRLEAFRRRILQEASVIGKSFLYEILQRITEHGDRLDASLLDLESADLLQHQEVQADIVYIFKHALAQEVVYNGLLQKDRKLIHERIAQVIEGLFADRLPEFYEALATHYTRGLSQDKAVTYLALAGEKSLARSAVAEAHQFYAQALELETSRAGGTEAGVLDLLSQWAFVYYYQGHFRQLHELLGEYAHLAGRVDDLRVKAFFEAMLGCALWHRELFTEAYERLSRAADMARGIGESRILGYAACWLTWTCTELGRAAESLEHARTAQDIYEQDPSDPYLFFNSLAGMGYAHWHTGSWEQTRDAGLKLLEFGQEHASPRSMVMGHCCLGWSKLVTGQTNQARRDFQQALASSLDPWYSLFPKLALCYGFVADGQLSEAEIFMADILETSQEFGVEFVGRPAEFFKGISLLTQGFVSRGLSLMESCVEYWERNSCIMRYVSLGAVLARIYTKAALKEGRLTWSIMLHNPRGMLKLGPGCRKRAMYWLDRCSREAQEADMKPVLGQLRYLQGRLQAAAGRADQAGESFSQALELLLTCGASADVARVRQEMGRLGNVDHA
jgi:class 3 adenylate cyclase/tetratricopeptide (TPR) repeat protein